MEKKKVIVYVDGYNFYYGLKHGGSKELLNLPRRLAWHQAPYQPIWCCIAMTGHNRRAEAANAS